MLQKQIFAYLLKCLCYSCLKYNKYGEFKKDILVFKTRATTITITTIIYIYHKTTRAFTFNVFSTQLRRQLSGNALFSVLKSDCVFLNKCNKTEFDLFLPYKKHVSICLHFTIHVISIVYTCHTHERVMH